MMAAALFPLWEPFHLRPLSTNTQTHTYITHGQKQYKRGMDEERRFGPLKGAAAMGAPFIVDGGSNNDVLVVIYLDGVSTGS